MIIKILIAISFCLCISGCTYDERIDKDPILKALYEDKDNPESTLRIGLRYKNKYEDKKEAIYWLKESFYQGLSDAALELANIDSEKMNYWYEEAAYAGNCKAMYKIAYSIEESYRKGQEYIVDADELTQLQKKFDKAIGLYTDSFNNGCFHVANDIAFLYLDNRTTYSRSASEFGDYIIMKNNTPHAKKLIKENHKTAENWFIKGGEKGSAESFINLADIYKYKKNYRKVNEYYQKAYDIGTKKVLPKMLDNYEKNIANSGLGLRKLYLEGLKNNNKTIIKKYADFLDRRGEVVDSLILLIHLKENVENKQKELLIEANKKLENYNFNIHNYFVNKKMNLAFDPKVNLKKHPEFNSSIKEVYHDEKISYKIGLFYLEWSINPLKALSFLELSYKLKRDAKTAEKIALAYTIQQNQSKSIDWYNISYSISNRPNVSYSLGMLYKYKLKNYKKAAYWFKASYKEGDLISAYELADIFENIINDTKKASYWYKISSKQGYPKAIEKLKNINTKHNTINRTFDKIKKADGKKLLFAVEMSKFVKVKLLLDRKSIVNYISEDGESALSLALSYNNIEMINLLLKYKPGLDNYKFESKIEPLIWMAIKKRNYKILELLINNGANINLRNLDGETILHSLVKLEKDQLVEKVLKKHINISIKDNNGTTALEIAVTNKDKSLIELINRHKNLVSLKKEEKLEKISTLSEEIDSWGDTKLMNAIDDKNFKKIKHLLMNGADINFSSMKGRTPLIRAIFSKNIEILKLILSYNPIVNSNTKPHLSEPIWVAMDFTEYKMVEMLIDAGAEVNVRNHLGNTILHTAVDTNNLELVKKILKTNININAINNNGLKAIFYAKNSKNSEIIELINNYEESKEKYKEKNIVNLMSEKNEKPVIESFEDEGLLKVGETDDEGNNALIEAIFMNNTTRIEKLLKLGANVNYINPKNKWTPLIAAIAQNNEESIKLLVKYNVDTNLSNTSVNSLWFAMFNYKYDILELLIKARANINILHNKNSLLHYAVARNNIKLVSLLLANGINTNIVDSKGNTAKKLAKKYNYIEILELLK